MEDKIDKKALKEVMTSIVENRNKELYAIQTREELEKKYFHFDFNNDYGNNVQRLRKFIDSIELLKHFARDWEKEKFGFTCCVDRVYQYYINPLCKKFEQTRKEDL